MDNHRPMNIREIIVASENPGKARELQAIFGSIFPGVHVFRPSERGLWISYPPEGDDYTSNAIAKARAAAEQTGIAAVADDSGIEVDHLDGAPGAHSARWGSDDEDRNDRLLAALHGVPEAERTARYRAVAAMAIPEEGCTVTAEATWEGVIIDERRGTGGFGYDPIFRDPELGLTGGEMSSEEKAARSHRGKALRLLAEKVRRESRP